MFLVLTEDEWLEPPALWQSGSCWEIAQTAWGRVRHLHLLLCPVPTPMWAVWAGHCCHREKVRGSLWLLALLGDNSHTGEKTAKNLMDFVGTLDQGSSLNSVAKSK